jgi:hypothetical protein
MAMVTSQVLNLDSPRKLERWRKALSVGFVFEDGEDGDVDELFVRANEVVEQLSFARKDAEDERGLIGDSWTHAQRVACFPNRTLNGRGKAKQLYGISGSAKSNTVFACVAAALRRCRRGKPAATRNEIPKAVSEGEGGAPLRPRYQGGAPAQEDGLVTANVRYFFYIPIVHFSDYPV